MVFLRLITKNGVYQIAGRVVRSSVTGLQTGIRYQSAICFENALKLPEETSDSDPTTTSETPVENSMGEDVSVPASQPITAKADEIGGMGNIVTLVACVPPFGPDIFEMFGVNKW
jgi:hypothetical protein